LSTIRRIPKGWSNRLRGKAVSELARIRAGAGNRTQAAGNEYYTRKV
jgi:hypothetical protein